MEKLLQQWADSQQQAELVRSHQGIALQQVVTNQSQLEIHLMQAQVILHQLAMVQLRVILLQLSLDNTILQVLLLQIMLLHLALKILPLSLEMVQTLQINLMLLK